MKNNPTSAVHHAVFMRRIYRSIDIPAVLEEFMEEADVFVNDPFLFFSCIYYFVFSLIRHTHGKVNARCYVRAVSPCGKIFSKLGFRFVLFFINKIVWYSLIQAVKSICAGLAIYFSAS